MSNGHPARDPEGRYAEESFRAIYDSLTREVHRVDENLALETKRIDGLRAADQISLQAALTAAKTAVDAALAAAEKAVAAALIAAKEAVNKAELAQQRTNEGQNEFRGQLKDQANTLLPRTEYELAHQALEDKIDDMKKVMGDMRSRLDLGPPSLSTLQARSDEQAGEKKGTSATMSQVLAAATAAAVIGGTVVGIVINLAK